MKATMHRRTPNFAGADLLCMDVDTAEIVLLRENTAFAKGKVRN